MIQAILSILGIGGRLWERRQDLKAKELEAETQVRIKRMNDAASWETIVAGRSGRFLRWTLALHLLAGLDATIYLSLTGGDPSILFDALAKLPNWYAGLLSTMFAWSFASEPLKQMGGKLMQGWRGNKALKENTAKLNTKKSEFDFGDNNS